MLKLPGGAHHPLNTSDSQKGTVSANGESDLHLYSGSMPTMEEGDIIGHEPMGIVVEVGSSVKKFKKGDRVVVPFVIACGECFFRQKTLYSCCDTTNPNKEMAEKAMGYAPAGLFGYSGLTGRYPGGQAEFLRVPHADVGPIKIDSSLSDDQVVFLSDISPTGYMALEDAPAAYEKFQNKTDGCIKVVLTP
jgi:threonine dehydrogenase-like Zn-dependent dehydrogenase